MMEEEGDNRGPHVQLDHAGGSSSDTGNIAQSTASIGEPSAMNDRQTFLRREWEDDHESCQEVDLVMAKEEESFSTYRGVKGGEDNTASGPPPTKKAKGSKSASIPGFATPPTPPATAAAAEYAQHETASGRTTKKKGGSALSKSTTRKKSTTTQRQLSEEAEEAIQRSNEEIRDEERIDEDSDSKLYCICQALYDEERMMIACDRCDDWYHAVCMDVKEIEAELVDVFICPKCVLETDQRTSWKPKCLLDDCTHAALRPLSRYCSERCGTVAAAKRITKLKQMNGASNASGPVRKAQQEKALAEKLLRIPSLQSAQRREGMVSWEKGSDEKREEWLRHLRRTDLLPLNEIDDNQLKQDEAKASHASDLSSNLPHLEELGQLQKQLDETLHELELVTKSLDIATSRLLFLHLAEDRVTTLEPLREEEGESISTSKAKKAKAKKNKAAAAAAALPDAEREADDVVVPQTHGQPRCGYDERLHWNDERFHTWSSSTEGKAILNEEKALDGRLLEPNVMGAPTEDDASVPRDTPPASTTSLPTICGHSKRKCKRHLDWTRVRLFDLEVEKEQLTHRLSILSSQKQQIDANRVAVETSWKQASSQEEERRRLRDEQLARAMANEGTRRAALVS